MALYYEVGTLALIESLLENEAKTRFLHGFLELDLDLMLFGDLDVGFCQPMMQVSTFDPLLILYVCPLTKKVSVYNFNGRFIWTVIE